MRLNARGPAWIALTALVVFWGTASCESPSSSRRAPGGTASRDDESSAPYQSEVEEGLGVAVAILVDTSGSMAKPAPGDSRPKYLVAQEALETMLDATDAFVSKKPNFPIKIGVFSFSSGVSEVLPIQKYDRAIVRRALATIPGPGGGTAIGDALREARPALYRSGVFRKYLLVVTDGDNTAGRPPEQVTREIARKSEGAVQVYFVAFDTSPQKFSFLKDVGGDVFVAGNGAELKQALDAVYQGKILAEAPGAERIK